MQKLGEVLPPLKIRNTGENVESSTGLALPRQISDPVRAMEAWHTGEEWMFNTPLSVREAGAREIPRLEANLAPATKQEMALVLNKLFTFAEALGKGPKNTGATTTIYAEALGDLPADLLMQGTNRTIKAHQWNTLPTPAEIIQAVEPEMTKRRRQLWLAREATR